ncbi:MAG: hypothetical protein O6939_08590 [Bacteroidetes bacterium]|nr:hypothetical protein [Bacteroidota bacterium]
MKNYEEIDDMIRQALSEEEAKFYDELGEQTLPEMVGGLFKGRLKWLTIMTMVIMVILFALAVYCAVQFLGAEDLRLTIIWGAGAFFFLLATSMLKLFHWMQMDKNAVIREIKRLELQVGLLNSKLEVKV